MKPNPELRLWAVLLSGGLVYAGAKGLVNGWNGTQLFSGFLFGTLIALCLGIPLLLLSDRRCPGFRGRHVLSGLIQALVACLLIRVSTLQLVLLSLGGGLAWSALYSLLESAVQRLAVSERPSGWRLLALPLAGALTLGGLAALLYPKGSETVVVLLLGAAIGAWLSMLVCWPVQWLVERWLRTAWRHVIGGGLSGGLIGALSGVPWPVINPQGPGTGMGFWGPLLTHGIVPFVLIGLLAGGLFSLLNRLFRQPGVAAGN